MYLKTARIGIAPMKAVKIFRRTEDCTVRVRVSVSVRVRVRVRARG